MTERNLCTESGCKAYCCFEPIMHFEKLTREQLLKYWPEAKQTLSIEAVGVFRQKGVFFKKDGNGFTVRIVGYCPNVDEDFNCKIENDKPEPCRNFELGKGDCIALRLKHSLPTYREWAYRKSLQDSEVVK